MVRQITVKKILSDDEIKDMEGEYFSEDFYRKNKGHFINYDCDVYKENGELLLKFRKNIISNELCKEALNSFREASKKKHEKRRKSEET